MDKIDLIKKEYMTRSTGPIEKILGWTIKHDLTTMNLNIF